MRFAFLISALTLLQPAYAAPAWTNIGPSGGDARSISSDASGPNVYLLNPRSGIFCSIAGGPWTLVFDAMARRVTPTRVVVDPRTARVYVGTSAGLFRSDDHGATWQSVIDLSIIDATANADVVVISTSRDGLQRSSDSGTSWNSVLSPPGADATPVSIIRIDPRSPPRLVAVVAGNLFISENGGDVWQQFPPKNITAIAFGDSIYAGGQDAVWACSDVCTQIQTGGFDNVVVWQGSLYASAGGALYQPAASQWNLVAEIAPWAQILSLEPTLSGLYAGTTAGVYASTNGTKWVSRNEGLTNVKILAMTFAGSSLVAATAGQSVLTRVGSAWLPADAGLPRHDPLGPNVQGLVWSGSALYAAIPGDGVFTTASPFASWFDVSSGLPSTDIFDLAADGDKVVITTFRKVARSLDRGATWQTSTTYPAFTATAIAVKGRTIVVADVANALISSDDGATWQVTDVPTLIRDFAITDDRIYAATDRGLFVRRNGAWTLALAGKVNGIAAAGSLLFAEIPSGIYFSDNGVNWIFVPGSETLPPDITSLASDGVFVYAGTNGGSILAAPLPLQQRRRAVSR